MAELDRTQIRGRGLAIDFPSHLLSRGYASSVAGRLDSTKPSQAVRHTTHARSVSNRYLARRSRARVMLEPRAPSQISKFCNNRQNRSIFENVDIRAEDTDVFLYGNPVTWFSEKQSDVSLSSTEAEYKTLTAGFKEAHYFINLMQVEMKIPVTPITSYIDNVAAAIMAEQSVTNKRTKHINLRYHYAREQIKEGGGQEFQYSLFIFGFEIALTSH